MPPHTSSLSPLSLLCREIRERFDAQMGWCAIFSKRNCRFIEQHTVGASPKTIALLREYSHIDDNLWLKRGVHYPRMEAITHHELSDPIPNFYETKFFRDLVDPCGIHQGLSYIIEKNEEFHFVFAGFRHAKCSDFTPSERQEGLKFAEQISNDYSVFLRKAGFSEASLALAMLDMQPCSWLVIDADRVVKLAHKSVKHGIPPLLTLCRRRRVHFHEAKRAQVDSCVKQALEPRCLASCLDIEFGAERFWVRFNPIPGGDVAIIVRRELSGRALAAHLEKNFSLSPAQAALASEIQVRREFDKAAKACNMTLSVARETREVIMCKLGAKDFEDLLRKLDIIAFQG